MSVRTYLFLLLCGRSEIGYVNHTVPDKHVLIQVPHSSLMSNPSTRFYLQQLFHLSLKTQNEALILHSNVILFHFLHSFPSDKGFFPVYRHIMFWKGLLKIVTFSFCSIQDHGTSHAASIIIFDTTGVTRFTSGNVAREEVRL